MDPALIHNYQTEFVPQKTYFTFLDLFLFSKQNLGNVLLTSLGISGYIIPGCCEVVLIYLES